MPSVTKKHRNEPFEVMFKRFKKAVENANTMKEVRSREHFEKPSELRKRKKAAARKRWERKRAELEPQRVGVRKER